ncbi:acyl-CoA thioesterase domain-containing protein [Nocardia callitridis]|uniref:Acyl-CoA thioesterase-like N-terminal HotDog domain-containing protein n=1 Tax=Nocardia callitridis TaxID=648753 RepID=A0ABP9KU95_9NOCA
MPRDAPVDGLRAAILTDIDQSARTGAPPLGHLVGLHRIQDATDLFILAFEPTRPAMLGGPGLLEVAMLADLALGGVLRNEVGPSLSMPTITMTIQLAPATATEVRTAAAEVTAVLDRTGMSRCRLLAADGAIVGDAAGVFALPARPYDGPGRPMPWDSPPGEEALDTAAPELGRSNTDGCLDSIEAHALTEPEPERAWGTAHIAQQVAATADSIAMTPTGVLGNRLGHVQGGAMVTAAVRAIELRTGFTADELASVTAEFVGATTLDGLVVATVDVLKQSPRSLFARVALTQEGQLRCHVSAVFRK